MNEFRSDIKNNHTNYNKYGGMYGRIQNNEEIGKWAAGAYASTKGALPLLHITAEIAVLPFGGVESAGKLGIRLILKAGAKAGGKTLFKESVKTGIQKLAGQEVDLSKRGKEIAIDVAASALIGSAGIVKDKFIGDLTNKLMKFESEESKAIFQKFLGDLIDKTRASLSDKAVKDLKQAATTED